MGNAGDAKAVGGGVSELRINYGPGYRVYFTQRRLRVVVLLCGGDKRTQAGDIERAIEIAKEWK
jgi:putative addiction module killer protein